jgi:hypothetical protein
MDVLKKFAHTKRQLQSLRKELEVCENDINVVESKLKNTTSFGDIIVKNAKYVKYSEHVQIYYSWLKTKCLTGLTKDKSDAKWAWFDFQRETDVNYYFENEDTLYLKVLDTWEKANNSSVITYNARMRNKMSSYSDNNWIINYPHPTFKDYNKTLLWSYENFPSGAVTTGQHMFTLPEYKEELKRCEDELNKVKDIFNNEYDKLNKNDYKSELSCLVTKRDTLKQSLQNTENELEYIISEIDSITDDYDELRTNSNVSTISGF